MRILVTGGAGFIGANFIYYLKKHHPGDRIICLDKLTYAGNLSTLEPVMHDEDFLFSKTDICDREGVFRLFDKERPDVVVNFAAESHVDRSIETPGVFLETNIIGTSETPLHTSSPYSSSKAAADLLAMAYWRTYGLPVTVSRCSNNYGPYQFPEKLIPLMIINALSDKPLPVYGKGINVRDWLYVEDHCRAIDLIVREGVPGEVYNIGGHNEMRNIDIVRMICREVGKPESLITFVTDRKGHDMRYAIDPGKIHASLGWLPETKFEDGLKKTVRWYLDNRSWWETIVSGEYRAYYEKMYHNR